MNQTFKRTITALILLAIVVLSVMAGNQYFIYLTHAFAALLQVELGLLLFKNRAPRLVIPFVLQCFLISLVFCYLPIQFVQLFLFLNVVCIAAVMVIYSEKEISELATIIYSYTLGVFYVGVLPPLTTKLVMTPHGSYWFFICICVVFSGDIAAYFTGRKFGKRKLIPSISPNKTWEGALGGLITSVLVGSLIGKYFFPHISILLLTVSCAVASFLAQSGDFFESLLKRIAGSKDSGFLLPGHGGFLDRFDGILFALPVFYYIAN
jgi:phosphatidate cytidylyltransferase